MPLPSSAERVKSSTSPRILRQIEKDIAHSVEICLRDPSCIATRLEELDQEWDIERVLEANASMLILTGLVMGTFVHRNWLALPAVVGGFLLQHAIQGWCPPLPVLRRMGFRTAREIETERHALKAMRGDYDFVADADNPVTAVLEAVTHTRDVPDAQSRASAPIAQS